MPAKLLSDLARESVGSGVPFGQPVSENADLIGSQRDMGYKSIKVAVPGGPELTALMNGELAKTDHPGLGFTPRDPTDVIDRI